MNVNRLLVVGAGAMGSQIALVAARAGLSVSCHDIDVTRFHDALSELRGRSARDIAKGNCGAAEEAAAFARLEFGTDLPALASGADFVVEAALEDLDVKRDLFATLDRHTPPHAILATNSSGFMPSQLADATHRPGQVCNLHFFNPALKKQCVEIVAGPSTAASTIATATALVQRLGKTPVVLDREIPGFIANRILNAVRDEAIFLYENGVAPIDVIDTACRTALGYPMGPFELMDLTGIDIGYHVKRARFEASRDPKDAPSRTVAALVEQGNLGRKTGRGFYTYDNFGKKLATAPEMAKPPPSLED